MTADAAVAPSASTAIHTPLRFFDLFRFGGLLILMDILRLGYGGARR